MSYYDEYIKGFFPEDENYKPPKPFPILEEISDTEKLIEYNWKESLKKLKADREIENKLLHKQKKKRKIYRNITPVIAEYTIFISISEAASFLNVDNGTITNRVNQKYPGYRFVKSKLDLKLIENYEQWIKRNIHLDIPEIDEEISEEDKLYFYGENKIERKGLSGKNIPVIVNNIEYSSITAASREIGVNPGTIIYRIENEVKGYNYKNKRD